MKVKQKQLKIVLFTTMSLVAIQANASEFGQRGHWESGYAQGYVEYVSGTPRGYINLTCDGNESMVSSIMLVPRTGTSIDDFMLIIDGSKYLVMPPVSDLGASHYKKLYPALRNAKKSIVAIANGKQYDIPVKGNSKVLPLWGSKNFSCGSW